MAVQEATSWLLNGPTGWRTGSANAGISVAHEAGIRLAANPAGPLALSADSLGQLTLPRGLALSEDGTLYLLEVAKPKIKRFDLVSRQFVRLPTVGGEGTEVRRFCRPANIALAGRNLYVVDTGNERVQVFDRSSLALRHLWDKRDWAPVDVASQGGLAYILDQRQGRVYRHRPGSDALHLVVDNPAAAGRWTRLAVDRNGRLYLLDPQAEPAQLHVYDTTGLFVQTVDDAGDVRDQFDIPPIRLDHRNRFCLPASLMHSCDRRAPQSPAPPELPLALCPPLSPDGLLFDREGNPLAHVDPTEPLGPPPYQKCGVWYSEALDSEIYQCQWHRLVVTLAALPAGAQVVISTYTNEDLLSNDAIRQLPKNLWETDYAITGQMQEPPKPGSQSLAPQKQDLPVQNRPGIEKRSVKDIPALDQEQDLLVQSRPGRYLWVRLELKGDGFGTPAVAALRIHFPRASYLDFLPAVFASDNESRWFLERYLSIFQTEWDALEGEIADISRYFDPEAVPAGPALSYLAQWLALPLEGAWEWEQKRRLLSAAPQIYAQRSTPQSLQRYLQIYLHNMTRIPPAAQGNYPVIVEGFRERQFLQMSFEESGVLGQGAPLWGPGMVGRLQLDLFARAGEVRLVSTGDPERDLLHHYAHRFRVFLPAAWVRTAEAERMVCRALDAEKPAHTQYDLCLVEPRLRVGIQSTVGLDTIIGGYPVARLACVQEDAAPSQAPRYRLGYDTILTGQTATTVGTHLRPTVRVGIDTIVQ